MRPIGLRSETQLTRPCTAPRMIAWRPSTHSRLRRSTTSSTTSHRTQRSPVSADADALANDRRSAALRSSVAPGARTLSAPCLGPYTSGTSDSTTTCRQFSFVLRGMAAGNLWRDLRQGSGCSPRPEVASARGASSWRRTSTKQRPTKTSKLARSSLISVRPRGPSTPSNRPSVSTGQLSRGSQVGAASDATASASSP